MQTFFEKLNDFLQDKDFHLKHKDRLKIIRYVKFGIDQILGIRNKDGKKEKNN